MKATTNTSPSFTNGFFIPIGTKFRGRVASWGGRFERIDRGIISLDDPTLRWTGRTSKFDFPSVEGYEEIKP